MIQKSLQLAEARQYVALELARAAGIPAYFLERRDDLNDLLKLDQ
jgi:hypothetical protein